MKKKVAKLYSYNVAATQVISGLPLGIGRGRDLFIEEHQTPWGQLNLVDGWEMVRLSIKGEVICQDIHKH